MSKIDIDAIRARERAATPGLWIFDKCGGYVYRVDEDGSIKKDLDAITKAFEAQTVEHKRDIADRDHWKAKAKALENAVSSNRKGFCENYLWVGGLAPGCSNYSNRPAKGNCSECTKLITFWIQANFSKQRR